MSSYIEKLCNDANEIFKEEALSGYVKYRYLPTWLKNKSYHLHSERISPQTNFRSYNRGTIVYVDFGVNIGYELSGNHFAIVLNKNDNIRSGIITVIPISSKDKSYYVPIGKVVEIESIKYLASHRDILRLDLACILKIIAHDSNKKEEEVYKTINKEKQIIIDLAKETTIDDAINRLAKKGLDWEDKNGQFEFLKTMEKDVDNYNKVFIKYQKYTKNSFAMPYNVQSISKRRIKRINKFDPAGNFKVSSDILDKIDKNILSALTNITS